MHRYTHMCVYTYMYIYIYNVTKSLEKITLQYKCKRACPRQDGSFGAVPKGGVPSARVL